MIEALIIPVPTTTGVISTGVTRFALSHVCPQTNVSWKVPGAGSSQPLTPAPCCPPPRCAQEEGPRVMDRHHSPGPVVSSAPIWGSVIHNGGALSPPNPFNRSCGSGPGGGEDGPEARVRGSLPLALCTRTEGNEQLLSLG